MTASRTNPKVDAYLARIDTWQDETQALRSIVLGCGLTEELKWGKPCYAFEGHNVVIIQGFNAYCALLFFNGVLLRDPHGVLVKTGANTKVGRQLRFTDAASVRRMKPVVEEYVHEAIEVEQSGMKPVLEEGAALVLPDEFQHELDRDPALKAAFFALTPGRQRAYNIYFSAAKQSATRSSRVAKCGQAILDGKGLNDR